MQAAFAAQLGGVSFPLIQDFQPKGAIGRDFGVYVDAAGLDARSTVIVDAEGVVRHASMASSHRDFAALAALCEELDASFALPAAPAAPTPPVGARLFIKSPCRFSEWALAARTNLHLEQVLPVDDVSTDPEARAELVARGGKDQAPALVQGDQVLYESNAIIAWMVQHCARAL